MCIFIYIATELLYYIEIVEFEPLHLRRTLNYTSLYKNTFGKLSPFIYFVLFLLLFIIGGM